jgi:hypothetical protein
MTPPPAARGTFRAAARGAAGLLLLVLLASVGAIGVPAGAAAARTRAASFPTQVFAPFVYVQTDPTFPLVKVAQSRGVRDYSLAFVLSKGDCHASWNADLEISDGFYSGAIAKLRAMGGDVIPSFGGAGGVELARSCTTVRSLRAQYGKVIAKYDLTRVDFDIEGHTLDDTIATARRNRAIAALQAAALAEGGTLTVQFTLPVGLGGLPQSAVDLLTDAADRGVDVGLVNIMTMDYGGGAPGDQMGQNAIDSTKATFAQLRDVFPGKSAAEVWAMIGITAMIGRNDVSTEVFTLDDASRVLRFAHRRDIGLLAFWNMQRDRQCPSPSPTARGDCSGVAQGRFAFTKILVKL